MNKAHSNSFSYPLVSVVLPTRGDVGKSVLIKICSQTYKNYEIIIVSDNPELKLPEGSFLKIKKLKVIYNKNKVGISYARNIGIKEAKGEIIAFIDDDAIPEVDWLEKLVECFTYTNADCIFGKVIPKDLNLPKIILVLTELYDTMVGCNMAFRKEALIKVGLFNEKIDYGGDENELIVRMFKQGYKISICPNAIVRHNFAKNYMDLFKKIYKGGKNAYLLKNNNAIKKIKRTKLIKELFLKREFLTIFLFSLLFIIRRIGIVIGKIQHFNNSIKSLRWKIS